MLAAGRSIIYVYSILPKTILIQLKTKLLQMNKKQYNKQNHITYLTFV